MFKYLKFSWFLCAAGLLLAAPVSNASTLSLGSGIPDLTTSSASVDYTFSDMCFDGDGGGTTGLCDTDNGLKGQSKITYDGAFDPLSSFGFLSVTGTAMTLDDGVGNFVLGGTYDLSANFDGYGNFVTEDSDVSADYTSVILQSNGLPSPGYSGPGIMVAGDLLLNGLSGIGDVGTVEFAFGITGGEFAGYGSNDGGILISLSGVGWDTGLDWDLTNGAGLDFWQHSFNTSSNVDTFVIAAIPAPAAVWLFGSGLLGLAGVARRRKGA